MRYFVADVFTDALFCGNPAGVCVLDEYPDKALMQRIAFENNLAETAFVVDRGDHYDLRWFTPEMEFDLCGHATIGSAFVIMNFVKKADVVVFDTMSGRLTVSKTPEGYMLDMPSRPPLPAPAPAGLEWALGAEILWSGKSRDWVIQVESQEVVASLAPCVEKLRRIDDDVDFALIVTAQGEACDFVSRYFAPNAIQFEDPVTGSAHCTLAPFWLERLKKNPMSARQLSQRGGVLSCEVKGDRVLIGGNAVLYLEGAINL